MTPMLRAILSGILIISNLNFLRPPANHASDSDYTISSIRPTWATGILSDLVGQARIVVAELNQDDHTDIATCVNGHVYVINQTAGGSYDPIWFSSYLGCNKITSADRDADGTLELYIATNDGNVVIIDGSTFEQLGTFALYASMQVNDIQLADVDGDVSLEIVVIRAAGTLVYDAVTYALEWAAWGYGGNQLGIGDTDGDGQIEIVANGNPSCILSAVTQTMEWAYSGGFGLDISVGDVDGDDISEIAFISPTWDIVVFEGDTLTVKWELLDMYDLEDLSIADVNGDGIGEVLVGDGQWGGVTGYQGVDGTVLWYINNPKYNTYAITSGDTDNDGEIEVVWGGGIGSSSEDIFMIGSWVTETIEWSCEDLDGPLYVAGGDVDNDGSGEIILVSTATNSYYAAGTIRIYDGTSHVLEWSAVIALGLFYPTRLVVCQLDSDPALEILMGGTYSSHTRMVVYDGLSHEVEWTSVELGTSAPVGLTVINLDGDAVDEIVLGLSTKQVQVFHGYTNILQWVSPVLDNNIVDVAIGDLDGNAVFDVAVLTTQSFYVFESATWTQVHHQAIANGKQIAILDGLAGTPGELRLVTADVYSNNTLTGWVGSTYIPLKQYALGVGTISNLVATDLDADGSQELVILGRLGDSTSQQSFLWIAQPELPVFWEYKMATRWGNLNGMAVADVDTDGQDELLLGSASLILSAEIDKTVVTIHTTAMPMMFHYKPRGVYGYVTDDGVPAGGVNLELRFSIYGETWSTIANTTTTAYGMYAFPDIPTLTLNQYYYVRYTNTLDPSRLFTWHTRRLDSFTAGSEVNIGDFDIGDITLVSPAAGASVRLPQTFQWTARAASPTDSYEFNIYDPSDPYTWFWTDPPLGYVSSYRVTGLPGFSIAYPYFWEIWVYSPDGGYGISYETRTIIFTSMNNSPQLIQPGVSDRSRQLEDYRP
jgi:hypothetical protein